MGKPCSYDCGLNLLFLLASVPILLRYIGKGFLCLYPVKISFVSNAYSEVFITVRAIKFSSEGIVYKAPFFLLNNLTAAGIANAFEL